MKIYKIKEIIDEIRMRVFVKFYYFGIKGFILKF